MSALYKAIEGMFLDIDSAMSSVVNILDDPMSMLGESIDRAVRRLAWSSRGEWLSMPEQANPALTPKDTLSEFRGTIRGMVRDIILNPFDLFVRSVLADRIDDEIERGGVPVDDLNISRSIRLFMETGTHEGGLSRIPPDNLQRLARHPVNVEVSCAAAKRIATAAAHAQNPKSGFALESNCGFPYCFVGSWEDVFLYARIAVEMFPIIMFRISGLSPTMRPNPGQATEYIWMTYGHGYTSTSRVPVDVSNALIRLKRGDGYPEFELPEDGSIPWRSIEDAQTALGRAVTDAVREKCGLPTLYTTATLPL